MQAPLEKRPSLEERNLAESVRTEETLYLSTQASLATPSQHTWERDRRKRVRRIEGEMQDSVPYWHLWIYLKLTWAMPTPGCTLRLSGMPGTALASHRAVGVAFTEALLLFDPEVLLKAELKAWTSTR
jgi:hypothetical protein